MPLDFIDFAHHYQGSGLADREQRAHFDAFADLMECLVRALWRDTSANDRLGISWDGDTLAAPDRLESTLITRRIFNEAASGDAAGKTAP